MKILVDADACPVKEIIEELGLKYNIPVIMFFDTSHQYHSEVSEVVMVSKGNDAVDFALINRTNQGDIVVSQDYGVAAMALGKRARVIHPNGFLFTEQNIDQMLMQRHIVKKERRAGKRSGSNQKRRSQEDDKKFRETLRSLCEGEK